MPETLFDAGYIPHDRPEILDLTVIGATSFSPDASEMMEAGVRFVGIFTVRGASALRFEIEPNGVAVFDSVIGSVRLSNTNTIDIRLTGHRAVIPPFFRVNWSDDFECTWTFRTQVTRSASGAEHRTAMLPLPVRIISYTHTEMPRDRGALHTWMRSSSTRRVAVPDGFGKAELALPSSGSILSVSGSASDDGITPGSPLILSYPGRVPHLCRCVERAPRAFPYPGPRDLIVVEPAPDWPEGAPVGTAILRAMIGFLDVTQEISVTRHSERVRDFEVRVVEAVGITDQPEVTLWTNGSNGDFLTGLIDHGQEFSGGYSAPDAYGNAEEPPLDGIGSPSAHLNADLRRSISFTASALRRPQARALLSDLLGRRGKLLSFVMPIPDQVFTAVGKITVTGRLIKWDEPHGLSGPSVYGFPVVIRSHHGGETAGSMYIATFSAITGDTTAMTEEPLVEGLEEFTTIVESVHPAGVFRLASDEITVRSRTGAGIEIDVAAIEVQA